MRVQVDISPVLQVMIPTDGNGPPAGTWDLAEGSGVDAVLKKLDFTQVPILLFLNGEVVDEGAALKEGDTLKIFPMVQGGWIRTEALAQVKVFLEIGQAAFLAAVFGKEDPDIDEAKRASDFLDAMIRKGNTGKACGSGFYQYPDPAFAKEGFVP